MKGIEIVKEFLGKVSYPINKTKLVEAARNFRMDQDIMRTVEALPDKTFASLEDVIPHMQEGMGAKVMRGMGEKVGNVIGGGQNSSAKVGSTEHHGDFLPDHPELDALAKTRRKPSQAEGEREFDEGRGARRMPDDEGRTQST